MFMQFIQTLFTILTVSSQQMLVSYIVGIKFSLWVHFTEQGQYYLPLLYCKVCTVFSHVFMQLCTHWSMVFRFWAFTMQWTLCTVTDCLWAWMAAVRVFLLENSGASFKFFAKVVADSLRISVWSFKELNKLHTPHVYFSSCAIQFHHAFPGGIMGGLKESNIMSLNHCLMLSWTSSVYSKAAGV